MKTIKRALIIGSEYTNWKHLKGITFKNSTVIIKNYMDIHLFANGPKFLANTVFVSGCDKNFVYYWIDKLNFPNMKELYLMSHPCEPEVLSRTNYRTYLSSYYSTYKERWAKENNEVVITDYSKMEKKMEQYVCEEPIYNSAS